MVVRIKKTLIVRIKKIKIEDDNVNQKLIEK